MHHLSAKGKLGRLWRVDIGDGSDSNAQLLASPVVSGDRVYTMDVDGRVQALNAETGDTVWRVRLRSGNGEDDDGISGGGVAVANGRLFVTTGFAEVIALDAKTGGEVWRRRLNGPMRAAPTVFKGRVFVVTIANELHALDARIGPLRRRR